MDWWRSAEEGDQPGSSGSATAGMAMPITAETAARDIESAREACARHDRQPVRIPIRKDVLIAESRAEAERVGDALVAGGYRGFDQKAVITYGDPEEGAEQLSVFGHLGFTDV